MSWYENDGEPRPMLTMIDELFAAAGPVEDLPKLKRSPEPAPQPRQCPDGGMCHHECKGNDQTNLKNSMRESTS